MASPIIVIPKRKWALTDKHHKNIATAVGVIVGAATLVYFWYEMKARQHEIEKNKIDIAALQAKHNIAPDAA
jgi:hypothetical protein